MNKFIDIANEVIESSGKIALNLLMPVAGPIINEAFDIPSHLSQKRKQKHLELSVKKLEKINENLIDHDFIQSEDFIDLIQAILVMTHFGKSKNYLLECFAYLLSVRTCL